MARRYFTRTVPKLSKPFKTKYGMMRNVIGKRRIFATYKMK